MRKRKGGESQYREEREKIIKLLNAHATITVHICIVTIAIVCIYAQLYTHWCGCFFAQNV